MTVPTKPERGPYRRKRDGVIVQVLRCTGNGSWLTTVTVRSSKTTSYVRLENFWKKYEAVKTESGQP